jgi:hypothetical protein
LEKKMLELTQAVKQRLHKSLATADKPEQQGKCFRIVPEDERILTLKLARPAPSDTVFTHKGDKVLALPKALRPFFQGKSLDIDAAGTLRLSETLPADTAQSVRATDSHSGESS